MSETKHRNVRLADLARDFRACWTRLQKAHQALADEKTDGLDRSEYIKKLLSEATKLLRKQRLTKPGRKGESL